MRASRIVLVFSLVAFAVISFRHWEGRKRGGDLSDTGGVSSYYDAEAVPAPGVGAAVGIAPGGSAPMGAGTGASDDAAAVAGLAPGKSPSFPEKLKTTLAALPRQEELRRLSPEEVHRTPAPVLAAGKSLGEVAEALAADPSLVPEGLAFYKECAEQKGGANSIRALCFSNWQKWARDESAPPMVPAEVKSLAEKLGDFSEGKW